MRRLAFITAVVLLCSAQAARSEVQDPLTVKLSAADMQQIAAKVKGTRIVRLWRPASAFPAWSPLALPKRHTAEDGDAMVLWINVDHLELMTPRLSHPDDDVPLVAAVIAGTLDLRLDEAGWQHFAAVLVQMPQQAQYGIISGISHLLVSQFGVHPARLVSDAEFARDGFPIEVIRNMTPGVPGVEGDEPPPGTAMPKDAPLIAYVGRTDKRHPGTPTVWGDMKHVSPNFTSTLQFQELYMRTYVLATADMQPPETPEKRGYDEARAADEGAGEGSYTMRYAFAARYLGRVRALASH